MWWRRDMRRAKLRRAVRGVSGGRDRGGRGRRGDWPGRTGEEKEME